MTDQNDGPLRGWYDIHQALRVELADLRDHADRSADRDPEAVHAFDERFEFLRAVLTAHSAAEDGIIFAAMRLRGLESTDELTNDAPLAVAPELSDASSWRRVDAGLAELAA